MIKNLDGTNENEKTKVIAISIVRSKLGHIIREYLDSRGFVEVYLPSIVPFATDPVIGSDKELFKTNYKGKELYLAQSPQIFKQMVVLLTSMKIFSLQPQWRAEETPSKRHSLEYLSLDVELPIGPEESELKLMRLLEDLVVHSARELVTECKEEMRIIGSDIVPISKPFPSLSYDQAIELLNRNDVKVEWGEDLGYERELELGKILKERNVFCYFITHWPSLVKKFYAKVDRKDNRYTQTFDFDICGWEICSGAERETDIQILQTRFKEKNLTEFDYKPYLDLFQKKPVLPHGGFGLGFDRLLAKLLGFDDVKETLLFPILRNLADSKNKRWLS